MAENDNTITVVGRIGQEPELRVTDRGDVLNFTLATSERRRAPDGSWSDGPTSWFRVAAWHELGRHAHASFHRGQQVIVRGVLTLKDFPLQSGGTSRSAELRATALGHDLRWGTTTFTDAGRRPASSGSSASSAPSTLETETEAGQAQSGPRVAGDWGAPAAEGPRETVSVGAGAEWPADEDAPF